MFSVRVEETDVRTEKSNLRGVRRIEVKVGSKVQGPPTDRWKSDLEGTLVNTNQV